MKTAQFIIRGLFVLIFIVTALYIAGGVWYIVKGSDAPQALRAFYPWIENMASK